MDSELDHDGARKKVLDPLLAAQELLGLLEGAEATGLLSVLADGATAEETANQTGLELSWARTAIDALLASGVAEDTGEYYLLSKDWQLARAPDAVASFSDVVGGSRVTANQVRQVGAGSDYWSISAADRLMLAGSDSPNPFEGGFVKILQMMAEGGHPHAAALEHADRCLELGCGIAGGALSQLQAFPRIRIVGVEMSDDLAREAERRAELLGVADRFTVVRGDAGEFTDPELFDAGFWSQYYFPVDRRAASLETLFVHVRSGGSVAVPVIWFDDTLDSATSIAAQRYSLFRVMAQSWGVPERSPTQVAEELVAAGFADVQVFRDGPTNAMLFATRP